jgi:hypothetical protein
MPKSEAKIKLTLEDHASKALDKSRGKLKQFGETATKVGRGMSMFVTGPLMAMGAVALKKASDFEEMESKFNVVFGKMAEQTKSWAETFGDSVNRSTNDVMAWMSTLQDTFVPLGFAREKGAEMSKTLAKLTVDMASFNNESEANVLRDMQSALVGNHETMRKYGVIITQATLDQELLNMGIEGGVRAATEQEKVLARMNIIMAGTSDAQGDAARTADSFANRMRGLKAQVQEVLIQLGSQLLPIASDLIGVLTKAAQWFGNLTERQQKIIVVVAGVVAAIGPLLLIVGQVIAAIQALIPVVIAMNAAMAANPILAVVAAVALLATGAVLLIKNWDKVKAFFVNLWNKLKELWDRVPNWVKYLMPFIGLPTLIIKNWGSIAGFFQKIGDGIAAFVDRFLGFVEKIREGVDKVTGFFSGMYDKLVGNSIIPDMVQRMDEEFTKLKDVMQSNAEEAVRSTKGIFGHLAEYMETTFKADFESTMQTVWMSAATFGEKMKETFKRVLADVLIGLARTQAGLAALSFLMPWKAVKHAAASAALFAAAGAVMSLAQGGEFVTNGPQMIMVGDNPSGRERVSVEPMGGGGSDDQPLVANIYVGGKKLWSEFTRATKNKQALVHAGAIVNR